MRRQIVPAVLTVLCLTVLTGLVFPLAVYGVSQVAFHDKANGSLVKDSKGNVVGSSLIGQQFDGAKWFHPRPSAAGDGYDPLASGGSNLGPTNPELISAVEERAAAYRTENGLAPKAEVPVDAVTASSSGLDPHISVANAETQAPRVAEARDLPLDTVLGLVEDATAPRALGVLGEPGVNVLELNLALDRAS